MPRLMVDTRGPSAHGLDPRDPGVAGSGKPLFAPLRAALIRRAC